MKKIGKTLLAALLALALLAGCRAGSGSSSASGSQSAQSGRYTVTGSGYGGDVAVEVTIENGAVTGLELGEHKESLVVIERAFPLLRQRILEAGTADVDSVSGATFSSYAAVTLEDVTTDLVIVGGGPSGLAAAINAKETNPDLRVLLVEKLDILSGNGKFDLNFYDMFNSEAQKANGVEDSKEQFLKDMKDAGDSPARLQVWADGEEVMDAWLRGFGVTLDYNYGGRNHMATKDNYAGQMIQREMEKQALALGVEIRTGTAGTDLVMEDDAVKGVSVRTSRNESYRILAGATIIATGGFSCNQDLLEEYAPDYVGYATSNQMGATGDFVPVFEKYGMKLENMGKIRMIPLILLPSRDLTNSGAGTVLVNQDGERFVNERNSELALAEPIRQQESVWMVVDSQKAADHANVRKQVKEGRFTQVATLEEAARVIGCDYNQATAYAGNGSIDKTVGGDVHAYMFHAHQRALSGKRHAQCGFHRSLFVGRPAVVYFAFACFGSSLYVFGDFGRGSTRIGINAGQSGIQSSLCQGFVSQ